MSTTTKIKFWFTVGLLLFGYVQYKKAAPAQAGLAPVYGDCSWSVEPGDTLHEIAVDLQRSDGWLLARNPHISDPDLIMVGDELWTCDTPSGNLDPEDRPGEIHAEADEQAIPVVAALDPGDGSDREQLKNYVRARMGAEHGWVDGEWDCLEQLIQNESSWTPFIANPDSSARGLGQFMPSTANTYGMDHPLTTGEWATIPDQATVLFRYIGDRYGTPCGALSHWLSRVPIGNRDVGHWY